MFSILKLRNTVICRDTTADNDTGKGQINVASKTAGDAKGVARHVAVCGWFSILFWLAVAGDDPFLLWGGFFL
jgi:hypothetical protein